MNLSEALENYEPVPESGCWLWLGQWNRAGYGQASIDGVSKPAHRVFFSHAIGQPVRRGVMVCHKCDTPACVNPTHLFAGTNSDNMLDMYRKGRAGVRDLSRKLDVRAAEEIHGLRGRMSNQAIADRFGISIQMVANVLKGRSWRKVAERFQDRDWADSCNI